MTKVADPNHLPRWMLYQLQPWWLVLDGKVITVDEADGQEKPMPPLPHLYDWYQVVMDPNCQFHQDMREQWGEIYDPRRIFFKKSRQIMATWFFAFLFTWLTFTRRNTLTGFLKSTEPEAIEVLHKRMWRVWDGLDASCFPVDEETGKSLKPVVEPFKNRLECYEMNSRIMAFPEGIHKMRGQTYSYIYVDEGAIMADWTATYAGCGPALGRHERCRLISTSSPEVGSGWEETWHGSYRPALAA